MIVLVFLIQGLKKKLTMTIEIHTPHEGLNEEMVQDIKQAMIRLSHQYKSISRIEFILREEQLVNARENKVCEIKVTIFGENLFTHSRTQNYVNSINEAVQHIGQQVALLASRENELPDKVTTTVKV